MNTINAATSVAIDASAVTGLASDTVSNIKTLLTTGNDTDQFTSTSFSSLATAVVSDSSLSVADLTGAIDQANTTTGGFEVLSSLLITERQLMAERRATSIASC